MINLEVQPKTGEINAMSKREFYKVHSEAINKFANMGLSGREISFAVELETGVEIKPCDVINLVRQARRRREIHQLTPEEKADIAKTATNIWDYTDEVMKGDVLSILQNIKRLQKEDKPLPQNRLELTKFRLPRNKSQQKYSGVQIGSKIIFPDGRHIPTFKGRKQTKEQRQLVAERNRTPKSREQVAKRSTVWFKVKPLRERLALSSEIAEITGLTKDQVKKAIEVNSRRPEWNRIPALTPEQVTELKKRSSKAKKPRNTEARELPTQDDKNSLVFAQKLLEEGLITSNLSYWIGVNELYKNSGRTLPDNFSQKLRLEVLFKGLNELKNGSSVILQKYENIGREISSEWFKKTFAEEEGFVKAKLLTFWADGEDAKGFFRLNENGAKERHVEIIEGLFVNENSMLAIKTLIRKGEINGNGNDRKRPKEKGWLDIIHPFDK